jgi:hypothetical protein
VVKRGRLRFSLISRLPLSAGREGIDFAPSIHVAGGGGLLASLRVHWRVMAISIATKIRASNLTALIFKLPAINRPIVSLLFWCNPDCAGW